MLWRYVRNVVLVICDARCEIIHCARSVTSVKADVIKQILNVCICCFTAVSSVHRPFMRKVRFKANKLTEIFHKYTKLSIQSFFASFSVNFKAYFNSTSSFAMLFRTTSQSMEQLLKIASKHVLLVLQWRPEALHHQVVKQGTIGLQDSIESKTHLSISRNMPRITYE